VPGTFPRSTRMSNVMLLLFLTNRVTNSLVSYLALPNIRSGLDGGRFATQVATSTTTTTRRPAKRLGISRPTQNSSSSFIQRLPMRRTRRVTRMTTTQAALLLTDDANGDDAVTDRRISSTYQPRTYLSIYLLARSPLSLWCPMQVQRW